MKLARSLAAWVPPGSRVLELGAGCGAVTRVLWPLHGAERLQCVELNARLARCLRSRFPRLTVHCDDAAHVLDALPASNEPPCLVSSLPFRSLPQPVAKRLARSICDALAQGRASRLVQFTYRDGAPFSCGEVALRWSCVQRVWANLPPAWVWVLERQAAQPTSG